MDYNIVDKYINFIRESYMDLCKIIFKSNCNKELCLAFIERYITVRYYNETNYPGEKDFINRINKELLDLLDKLVLDDNIEDLKNIVALFGYIVYFDDVCVMTKEMEVIDAIINDGIIKISNVDNMREELKNWYLSYNLNKENFHDAINTKKFNLVEEKIYHRLYSLVLEHNVRVSNLYSEYAIDKAYNSGVVNEDKLFITYILASNTVLNNAINLDFSRYYLVSLASSLFTKEKKINRLLKVLDTPLTKKFIHIRVTYTDYIENKNMIDKLINSGYSFIIELDSKYSGDSNLLYLFPYIMVAKDSPEYEMLMRDKDNLKSKIVKF